jgi:type IV secretion system protein VirB7
MRIPVLTVVAALALAACSSTGGGKLAVCDGKHLRPANPYGTVLAPAAEIAPAPTGGAAAKPKTLSSIGSPVAFGSCRA